jgi:MYXO-CTERM domain-containing protein
MDRTRLHISRDRVRWLRLAIALVLGLGLSSTATAATGSADPLVATTAAAVTHIGAATVSASSAASRSTTVVKHAIGKHGPPITTSALAVAGAWLVGLAGVAVRRRRREPLLAHAALSHGARAPPLVTGI